MPQSRHPAAVVVLDERLIASQVASLALMQTLLRTVRPVSHGF